MEEIEIEDYTRQAVEKAIPKQPMTAESLYVNLYNGGSKDPWSDMEPSLLQLLQRWDMLKNI